MEKNKIIAYLNSKGYQAIEENGVVMVLGVNGNLDKTIKEVRAVLEEKGYHASFGVRTVKTSQQEQVTYEQESNSEEILEKDVEEEQSAQISYELEAEWEEETSINYDEDGQLSLFL